LQGCNLKIPCISIAFHFESEILLLSSLLMNYSCLYWFVIFNYYFRLSIRQFELPACGRVAAFGASAFSARQVPNAAFALRVDERGIPIAQWIHILASSVTDIEINAHVLSFRFSIRTLSACMHQSIMLLFLERLVYGCFPFFDHRIVYILVSILSQLSIFIQCHFSPCITAHVCIRRPWFFS
jgi:hypothetical protein